MFLGDLRSQNGLLTEFDEALFRAAADRFTVHSEREVAMLLRDGTEIIIDVVGKQGGSVDFRGQLFAPLFYRKKNTYLRIFPLAGIGMILILHVYG